MAARLEGSKQVNEIRFQDPIDSFPHRDNNQKITDVISLHATDIEALLAGDPASGSEVVSARDQKADLGSAIRLADEIVGDGVIEGVLDDFEVVQSTVPDDKVTVKSGEAVIDGIKVRNGSTQVVDPDDFSLGITDPRIDVVYQTSSGTVAVVTGTPAASPEAEARPNNTVELSRLWLEPSGADPNIPNDIRDAPTAADSFIVKNGQRFFLQRDDTDPHRHPSNLINNGAFTRANTAGTLKGWAVTRGTLIQDSGAAIYGNESGKFTGDNTGGGSFIEFALKSPTALRGHFLTASAYLQLEDIGGNPETVTARIKVVQTGDTPESDYSQTVALNKKIPVRLHTFGRIDNSVTAVAIRIEVDITDPTDVSGFIDGVMASIGRILTEFEYPTRVDIDDDGNADFQDLKVTGSSLITGDEDSESMVLALAAQ